MLNKIKRDAVNPDEKIETGYLDLILESQNYFRLIRWKKVSIENSKKWNGIKFMERVLIHP